MNADERRLNEISERVIGCAYTISNVLGAGFLERVYENASAHELRKSGLLVHQQAIAVKYDGIIVGEYVVDMLVQREVLAELKAAKVLDDVPAAQCLNYLKATGLRLCLLMNFGRSRVDVRRIVLGL